jgi:hypothetical protein
MTLKKRIILIAGIVALCSILIAGILYLSPGMLSIQQKPDQTPQKLYDYYMILDEQDGHTLMYVPVIVNIDDEVLSEENKLYVIVKIEENRAYARFVRDVNLEEYKNK